MKSLKNIILSSLIYIAFTACAVMTAPSGGPKDITPPVVLTENPENFSTEFNKKKITFSFDEYILIKNLNNEFYSSPPMKTPTAKINGKSLTFMLNDSLLPNKTYILNFGNAIVDLHEDNPYPEFIYTFSTGKHIDSFQLSGKIIDAFDKTPGKSATVMLYFDNANDSIPYLQKPDFITKTNNEGYFTFHNLPQHCFKIIALNDSNKDLLFDHLVDKIAFNDKCAASEISKDTNSNPLILYTFSEKQAQSILSKNFSGAGKITIKLKNSVEKPAISFIKPAITEKDYLIGWNSLRNSFSIWIKDTAAMENVILKISDNNFIDTAKISSTHPLVFKQNKIKLKGPESTQNFFDSVVISFDNPIINFTTTKLKIFSIADTLEVPFKFIDDTKTKILLQLAYPLKESYTYTVFIKDSSFYDLWQQTNDSTLIRINTNSQNDFSSIEIALSHVKDNFIFQLLNSKDEVVYEEIPHTDKTIVLPHILPGSYRFKIIEDKNKNGIWDSGDYLKKQQPEKVLFYNKHLLVERSWDYQETWDLSNFNTSE